MNKMTIHKTLPKGRCVGDEHRPLHLRVDVEDGKLAKVTFGIEQRPGEISWQLSVAPEALHWGASEVENALVAAKMAANANTNAVDGRGEAT